MTTDEIKALVAKKLAGQGTNVDAASVLPTIINALCDAVDAASPKVLNCGVAFNPQWSEDDDNAADIASILKVTEQEVFDLYAGKYDKIAFTDGTILSLSWHYAVSGQTWFGEANEDNGLLLYLTKDDDGYDLAANYI